MNKKGILGLVAIIVLAIIGYVIWGGTTTSSVSNTGGANETPADSTATKESFVPVTKDSTDASLLSKLKNTSVSASESDTRVALSNGTAKFTDGDVKGTITMGDVAIETAIPGAKYAVTSLAINSGTSSTLKYVVLFENKNGAFTDVSYGVVGDRVTITGIRADVVSDTKGANQIVVSVSFLDHDKDEPLSAAPTVPRTKIFVVENGAFNSAKELTL